MLGGEERRGPTEMGEFAAVVQGAWWLSALFSGLIRCQATSAMR